MRSNRNCTHSTSPVAQLARRQILRAVRDLASIETRLALAAEALDPAVVLAASFSAAGTNLAAEMRRGIDAVRQDLLADAIATLEGLAKLQPADVELRQAEEALLLERLEGLDPLLRHLVAEVLGDADGALPSAGRTPGSRRRHANELGHRLAVAGDHHFLNGFHHAEQAGKLGLGFLDVHLRHTGS